MYTLLLLFMMSLLVRNFILAIIVESYMQVPSEIEKIRRIRLSSASQLTWSPSLLLL